MKPIQMAEHPEGGRFCEVFRSGSTVRNRDGQDRGALTHIYFSLEPHEVSHFHRVKSDEVWNLYQGQGLYLYLWDGAADAVTQVTLSAAHHEFCHVVPSGVWQAAVPVENSILVGCSVAPGFEFADFEMMRRETTEAELLCARDPGLTRLILAD